MYRYFFPIILISLTLTACQKPDSKTNSQANSPTPSANTSNTLVGCYTTMKSEPAQIKINVDNSNYTMQMREFNDPDKQWDTPEPLQTLAKPEVKSYFDIDEKSVETALIRPDKVFAIAKIQDSLTNLDARFDSQYLGYIAKAETMKGGSNTIYKVECGK